MTWYCFLVTIALPTQGKNRLSPREKSTHDLNKSVVCMFGFKPFPPQNTVPGSKTHVHGQYYHTNAVWLKLTSKSFEELYMVINAYKLDDVIVELISLRHSLAALTK